jgi:hypothetical protein
MVSRSLIRLLAAASHYRSAAGLAGSVGYSDQAHMCRDVREFTDKSLQALLRHMGSTLSMSDLLNTDVARNPYP